MSQTQLPTGNSIYGHVPLRPVGQNQQQTDIAPQKIFNGNNVAKSDSKHISEENVKHGIQPPRYDTVIQRRGTQKQPKDTTPTSIKHGTGKSTSGNMNQKSKTVCLREAIRDIENKASKDRSNPSFFTSSKPQENTTKLGSTSHGNKYEQNIHILTFNIEGIKSNLQYLHEILNQKTIICLQEHWLWNFESDLYYKQNRLRSLR
jgi:hypothetical protein